MSAHHSPNTKSCLSKKGNQANKFLFEKFFVTQWMSEKGQISIWCLTKQEWLKVEQNKQKKNQSFCCCTPPPPSRFVVITDDFDLKGHNIDDTITKPLYFFLIWTKLNNRIKFYDVFRSVRFYEMKWKVCKKSFFVLISHQCKKSRPCAHASIYIILIKVPSIYNPNIDWEKVKSQRPPTSLSTLWQKTSKVGKFSLNKIIWKVMKRKCYTQRTNNKKKTKERTRWKTLTVQEEKFLHTFEFKWENKFYANKCKVEKVIVNGTKQQWQRFHHIDILYNVAVFYLNSIKSQFLGNKQSVFTVRSIFSLQSRGWKYS